jgi:tetratricopeptide (TPR) repeat protein
LTRRAQLERLIQALILPSMPVALYAVVQRFGLDPMPWLGDVTVRVASTMGNSIFVAAYLIMVVPLTIVRLGEALRALDDDESSAAVLRVAGYLVLVFIQVLAVVLSQSRGPLLGLMGGCFFLLLLLAAYRGRKVMLGILGAGALLAAFLVVFNLPGSPLAPLREVPYIGRLGQVFEVGSGTGRVRVLIWDGAVDLIQSDPLRLIVGHGPETMHVVYNPFYPPELGNLESRNASPDRSHNEAFDSLVQTGLLGFAAYLFLFTSLFYYSLRWLGMIDNKRERNQFLALFFGCGIASAVGFELWGQSTGTVKPFTFFGVALPAGMIVGLTLYVVLQALRGGEAPRTPGRLLVAGLLGGLIAHFIEIHFGIAIAATRTLFFAMAGLLVVVGALSAQRPMLGLAIDEGEDEPEPAPTAAVSKPRAGQGRKRARRRGPRTQTIHAPAPWISWLSSGWLLLVILVTLTFDFIVRSSPEREQLFVLIWLISLSWLLGSLILGAEHMASRKDGSGPWPFAIQTGVGLLVYALLHWMTLAGRDGVGAEVSSSLLLLYYGVLLLLLLAWAWTLVRNDPPPAEMVHSRALWLYPLLAVGVVIAALFTNIDVVRADIWYKQAFAGYHASATQLANRGEMDNADANYAAAIESYDIAFDLNPGEDYYLLFKGKALLEQADGSAAAMDAQAANLGVSGSEYEVQELMPLAEQRDRQFEDALEVLRRARDLAPLNTDHSANMARAYQVWGDRTYDAARRQERLDESVRWFVGDEAAGLKGAIDLSPNNAGLWRELATTQYLAGDTTAALESIDKALEVDSRFLLPLRLRATMLVEEATRLTAGGDTEGAKEIWEKARQDYLDYIDSREGRNDATAWSGLSLVEARLGNTDGAREANKKVLEIAPGDLDTLRNLAILERDAGNPEAGCEYVGQGLTYYPGDAGLQQLNEALGCGVDAQMIDTGADSGGTP